MKYIDLYNRFIKLNEDIFIDKDIDKYDINIIKEALVELGDLGCEIIRIKDYVNENENGVTIDLKVNNESITQCIRYSCKFNKKRFNLKSEFLLDNNTDDIHEPTKYEQLIINTTKECSQLLLNMLDYDNGKIYISSSVGYYHKPEIIIILYKNKTK